MKKLFSGIAKKTYVTMHSLNWDKHAVKRQERKAETISHRPR